MGDVPQAGAEARLAALVAARICHDLANPIGAFSNGVELIGLGGQASGGELALLAGSAADAQARLGFLRLAFGPAPAGQIMAVSEAARIVGEVHTRGRFRVDWAAIGEAPRAELRLVCLCLQCCESLMPRGGRVRVSRAASGWALESEAERLRGAPELWALLAGAPPPDDLRPAEVQFALAPRAAAAAGLRLSAGLAPNGPVFAF